MERGRLNRSILFLCFLSWGIVMESIAQNQPQDCLFCRIAAGQEKSFKIWESEKYVAFLSIFPNTPGVTVVIPKAHFGSDIFSLSPEELGQLTCAAQHVAKILEKKLNARVALVYEGFGINHAHAKLFPMHGTGALQEWKPIKSDIKTWFDQYPGYISSHDGNRAEDQHLEEMQKRLIKPNGADIF